MGIRGAIKSGGGFWNNVDVTLLGVTFTTVPPGEDAESGEWMYMVPEVQVDGADGPTTQHLFMGAAERYSIEEDGASSISGVDDAPVSIGANTPAGKFVNSLLDANPELDIEGALPDVEAGEALTFEGIAGARLRLKQQRDEEGTKKRGKRKVKGKDGKTKEYDRTDTVVVTVYSIGGEKPAKGKPGAKPVAGKPAASKPAPGKKTDTEVRDKADAAVVSLCEAAVDKKNKTGKIPTSKISVGILKALASDKQKDAVRKLAVTEEYLADAAERDVIVYDADEATIELTESND